MTHDDLCPSRIGDDCQCRLIAMVREEQDSARGDLLYEGEKRMLSWAIKTVEFIDQAETSTLTHGQYLSRRAVLAALRALEP